MCMYTYSLIQRRYIYISMHICMFMCMYLCIHAPVHYIHAGVYVRIYVCILTVCMCVCMHVYVWPCTCACIHTHTHTHTQSAFSNCLSLQEPWREKFPRPLWLPAYLAQSRSSLVCPPSCSPAWLNQSPATSKGRRNPLTYTAGANRTVNNFSGEARDKNGLKYLIFAIPYGYTQLSVLSLPLSLTLFSCPSMKNLLGLNRITPRAINANAVSGQSHSNKCIFIWTVLLEKLNRGICSLSPPPDHPNSPHNGKERRAEQSWTFLKWIWSDVMIPLCINYQWNQPICCVHHRCIHGHPFYFGNRLNVLLFKLIAFEKFRAGLERGWWGRGLWTHTRVCKSVLKWTRGDAQRSEPKRQGFES